MILFLLLLLHHNYVRARNPLHDEENIDSAYGYIEAYDHTIRYEPEQGTDYEDSEKFGSYEYKDLDEDFRSGGVDSEVRMNSFWLS